MSSWVRLAAMMPARRATAMTSPLGAASSRIMASVAGAMRTRASARATRSVSSLPPTSTMRARPRASRWLSSLTASPSDLGHRALVGALFAAAVEVLARHRCADCVPQLCGTGDERPDGDLIAREEAGAQAAVGGQTQAVAALAEVPGDAGDEADGAECPGAVLARARGSRHHRLHRRRLRALLRELQPPAPHRRRPPAHLPLLGR